MAPRVPEGDHSSRSLIAHIGTLPRPPATDRALLLLTIHSLILGQLLCNDTIQRKVSTTWKMSSFSVR